MTSLSLSHHVGSEDGWFSYLTYKLKAKNMWYNQVWEEISLLDQSDDLFKA